VISGEKNWGEKRGLGDKELCIQELGLRSKKEDFSNIFKKKGIIENK